MHGKAQRGIRDFAVRNANPVQAVVELHVEQRAGGIAGHAARDLELLGLKDRRASLERIQGRYAVDRELGVSGREILRQDLQIRPCAQVV